MFIKFTTGKSKPAFKLYGILECPNEYLFHSYRTIIHYIEKYKALANAFNFNFKFLKALANVIRIIPAIFFLIMLALIISGLKMCKTVEYRNGKG